MQKLKLDLDALAVETFAPEGAAAESRGTVNAHAEPIISGVLCDMAASWLMACDTREAQVN